MTPDNASTEARSTPGQRLDAAIDSTRDTVGKVGSDVRERYEKGKEAVSEWREKGAKAVSELREKNVDDVISSAKQFAKDHPGTTLLAGVALGFMVGYLTRGRD